LVDAVPGFIAMHGGSVLLTDVRRGVRVRDSGEDDSAITTLTIETENQTADIRAVVADLARFLRDRKRRIFGDSLDFEFELVGGEGVSP
jgi:hypothetical protein